MRVLVTGSRGQLGNELRRCFETMQAEIGPIPQEYANANVDYLDADELNIASTRAVFDWFNQNEPYDLVINCAAITNVDGCEKNEAVAYHVNANGPENLAREVARTGGKFVQVSTDYVFPGNNPEPRTEEDPIAPISAYGRSKWAGEVLVLDACEQSFVVRTAWLYGYVGKNFVKTMKGLGSGRDEVTVVNDQLGNPTSANDLAYEILKMGLTENYGVYHCTNEGTCSWADFAQAIMEGFGLDCKVNRCTSAEYKQMNPASADRPAYSSLVNKHLVDTIGNEMRPWQDALSTYIQNFDSLEG